MQSILNSPTYEIAYNLFIVFSLIEFAVAEGVTAGQSNIEVINTVLYVAMLNNTTFFLHIVAQWVAFSPSEISKRSKAIYFEMCLQVAGLVGFWLGFSDSFSNKVKALSLFDILFLLRLILLLGLFKEMQ